MDWGKEEKCFGFEHGANRRSMKTQRNFRTVEASGFIPERMVVLGA